MEDYLFGSYELNHLVLTNKFNQMEQNELIEKLKKLKEDGWKNKDLETYFGFPQNSATNFLSGKKVIPKKYHDKILSPIKLGNIVSLPMTEEMRKKYIIEDNHFIELPNDYVEVKNIGLLKEDGTIEMLGRKTETGIEWINPKVMENIPEWAYFYQHSMKVLAELSKDATESQNKPNPDNKTKKPTPSTPKEKITVETPKNGENRYENNLRDANKWSRTTMSQANAGIPPMPTRNEGEDFLDFVQRKNEWKIKYNQK